MILTIIRDKDFNFESAVITNIDSGELAALRAAVYKYQDELQKLGFTEDDPLMNDTKRVLMH